MITFYLAAGGLLFTAVIGFFLYIANYLTRSGYFTFILLGTFLAAFSSPSIWFLLGLFFGSAILIHALKKYLSKKEDTIGKKGATRDAKQLLANSLPLASCALLAYFNVLNLNWTLLMSTIIAATTADTWASEIGLLSKSRPYNLVNFKKVAPGLSGGVSLLESLAAVGGSLLISATYALGTWLFTPQSFTGAFLLIPLLLGVGGMLIDSLLGATLQSKYQCQVCGKITEQENHHQKPCRLISGYRFIDNDVVNLISGYVILLLAIILQII